MSTVEVCTLALPILQYLVCPVLCQLAKSVINARRRTQRPVAVLLVVWSNTRMTPPVALALLAADRVARNRTTGHCDLLGVFHALALPIPTTLTFAAYYVLTGCHGPTEFAVEFLDPADRVLSRGSYRAPVDDSLAVVQGFAGIDCAPNDRPGTYRLRFTSADPVLAKQPVITGALF